MRHILILMLFWPAVEGAVVEELFAWQRAIAGMSAYCAATVVSSPVDVLKTRMQLQQDKADGQGRVAIAMLKKEGPLVFFSGIAPAMMMTPAAIVQYTLMDPLRAIMPLFLAALIAGALDITIKCPFDRVKTKMQGSNSKASTLELLVKAWKEGGARSLWSGYGATLVRSTRPRTHGRGACWQAMPSRPYATVSIDAAAHCRPSAPARCSRCCHLSSRAVCGAGA